MRVEQIETPALVLDYDRFLQNLTTLRKYLEGSGTKIRPHYKSNKCPDIVRLQLQNGACGICCAKLSEAEDAADAGIEDILIANEITDPAKVLRVAQLAGKCTLTVCVDNEENVRALSEAAVAAGTTIRCYVEYDTGMHRCGCGTYDEVLALIRLVMSMEGLRYTGLQAYAGDLSHMEDRAKCEALSKQVDADLVKLRSFLRENGVEPGEISGVSTGTVFFKKPGEIYTEIQTGSYALMDAAYKKLGLPFVNALFVMGSVISKGADRIVTDVGLKSFGMDQGLPVACGLEDVIPEMSEEHVTLAVPGEGYALNDRIRFIPGHCCTTVNLYNKMYVVKDGLVIDRFAVTGRGCSR